VVPGLTLEELAKIEMNALRFRADPQALNDAVAALTACIQNPIQPAK